MIFDTKVTRYYDIEVHNKWTKMTDAQRQAAIKTDLNIFMYAREYYVAKGMTDKVEELNKTYREMSWYTPSLESSPELKYVNMQRYPIEQQFELMRNDKMLYDFTLDRVNTVIATKGVGTNQANYKESAAIAWKDKMIKEVGSTFKNSGGPSDTTLSSFLGGGGGGMFDSDIVNMTIAEALGKPNSPNDFLKKFNKFKSLEFADPLIQGTSFVFFVKPDLNLMPADYSKNYPGTLGLLGFDITHNRETLNILSSMLMSQESSPLPSKMNPKPGYIPLLTNLCENFEAQDTTLRQESIGQTFRGFKLSIPGNDMDSISGGTLSVTYTELDNMPILLLHKIWIDYIRMITIGKFSEFTASGNMNLGLVPREIHRFKKIIDYFSSVYFFSVGPDGETLKYWCKYTGVYPLNIPYSAMSWEKGSQSLRKMSVTYAYTFKEDMTVDALIDFNKMHGNVKGYTGQSLPDSWNDFAYIDLTGNEKKLRFQKS